MNKKLIIMLSLAVIIAMAVTAFPLHIEPSQNSDWPFVITIGSPVSAQEADYTCDGAADDVQFQAAMNALPSAGGQLFVLAGNYTFADSTTVTRAIDHVSIIGVSAAVSFTGDGTTAIFTAGGDGWLFSNLEVDSGEIDMGAATDYMWLHVISNDTYYPLKTDSINIEDHSALHGVGGADTVFPADPDADKYLKWDDDPGELVWSDAGAGDGDMQKATYDQDEDGDIDTAAGGTEWDSSAATGVAYITAGAWGTRSTGISNTFVVVIDDADAANGDISYFTTSGLAGYNEAEFKTAYNMEAGTDYQTQDAELQAIAGLTSAANKMIYFTGSGTADVSDLTAFARSILDDTDEATFKATVNLEIGTDVQAQDAELSALAGLTSAADKLPYFTGSGTADVTGLSAFTRGFLDDADEATFKATVNLEIGTDVLAYDATLSSIADLGTGADKIAYTTGVDTWAETGLTAFARSILDDVDEATFKATVNLEIGTDVLAQQTIGIADDNLLEVDGSPNDDEFARFTANGLEGLTNAETLAALSGDAGATFDWNGQQLSNWGVESGSTVPVSPVTGQFFVHTPTGRTVLIQYDGSNWIPIYAFGTMTMYVDSAGTDEHDDDIDLGYDSTHTFDTIQYAVNLIPPLYSGDITIYVDYAGTSHDYDEAVSIRGKNPTAPYSISIIGNLELQASATADSRTTGSGATPGTVTDTGAFGSYDDLLIYIPDDDEWQIIDSDTSDVITIVGCFSDNTDLPYEIYDWGSSVNNIMLYGPAVGVLHVYNMDIDCAGSTTGYAAQAADGSRLYTYNCKTSGRTAAYSGSVFTAYQTWSTSTSGYGTWYIQTYATCNLYGCKALNTNAGNCVLATRGAFVYIRNGTVLDGESGATDSMGIYVEMQALVRSGSPTGSGYIHINNCDYGIYAHMGGQAVDMSNAQFSGMGSGNAYAEAASFGYEDAP